MAATKPRTEIDTADIQRQMAQVRNAMHQEVRGAVRSAQSLTDWQAAVTNHPWISLSIASAVGYLLVPRRHSQAPTSLTMSAPGPVVAPGTPAPAPEPVRSKWRFVGTALGLLAPVAVRAAQNYVLGHVDEWLSQNPLSAAAGRPAQATATHPGPATAAHQGPASRLREYG